MQSTALSEVSEKNLAGLLVQLEQMDDLPSPPGIVTQVIDLLKDPESDIKELIDALSKDPALVAKILRTANSAMYARRRQVTNLPQALLTLGQATAATLALSFSLVNSLRSSEGGGIYLMRYWQRTLLTAMTAREFGKHMGSDRTEELFLAGLLQDIGLQVLDRHMPEQYQMIENLHVHALVCKHEQETIGVDHAWIGAWLLERWELPDLICQAARYSHELSDESLDTETAEFVDCVAIASRVSDVLLHDSDESAIAALSVMTQDRLGMDEEATLGVLTKVEAHIPDIESQFGMDIMDVDEVHSILDRARRLLTDVSLNARREIAELKKEIDSLGSRAESLEEERHTDRLTGLRNRDFMEKHINEWCERARDLDFPLSFAFMDLDGFKAINDNISHAAGDEMLRSTAKLLTSQVRENDALARFGGDEFVLLLGGENEKNARVVCERIVGAFNETRHSIGGVQVEVRISVGLATFDATTMENANDLINAADEALKHAKRQGKARVVSYSEL